MLTAHATTAPANALVAVTPLSEDPRAEFKPCGPFVWFGDPTPSASVLKGAIVPVGAGIVVTGRIIDKLVFERLVMECCQHTTYQGNCSHSPLLRLLPLATTLPHSPVPSIGTQCAAGLATGE